MRWNRTESKANESGNAKDDKNTKLAEAQNNIVNKAADKDKIGKMLDGAFALTDGIIGLFGTDQKTRITPKHSDTVKVTDAEKHVDGACDAGGSYYCVCECGHIGETTFEQPAEAHHLIPHGAKAANCTEAGTIEHCKCENCGKLSADESGYAALTQDDLTVPAQGHKWGAWNVTKQQSKAADVNGDSVVSVDDAQLILIFYVRNTLSGKPATWDELLGREKSAEGLPIFTIIRTFFMDENEPEA